MSLASKIALYTRTLGYLKPGQIYWRVWYRLTRPRVDSSPRPELRSVDGHWAVPACRRQSLDGADKFSLLNQTGCLSELGWDGPQREKLWRYNQHYFDDLNAVDAVSRSHWHHELIKSWISENTPGQGTGWEPYPTSLRIVNWMKWRLTGNFLDDVCLHSLAIQVRFLSQRIEWHILGNHLFANAKALVFAGIFFNGPEASKWLKIGLDIIARQLPEQVLPDGGNFERSPMYHSIFLEDLLDLINLVGAYPNIVERDQVDYWRSVANKMLRWLKAMCHPDGEIAFFNDAAIGVAPSPTEIEAYASRLGIIANAVGDSFYTATISKYIHTGYIRLESINAVVLLDVAPIGPDYLPGHAHADTLSFECSLFGERVLVNSGTSQYGTGKVRQYERGTQAHNTLVIDGVDSSEVWAGFRVARRAYPKGLEVNQTNQSILVTCAHDGYSRLAGGGALHRRSWQLDPGKLVIHDQVIGKFDSVIGYFHFHPGIKVTPIDQYTYLLYLPSARMELQLLVLGGEVRLSQGYYAPEFGVHLKNQSLAVRFQSNKESTVEISWSIND